jgi:hypothetical protein
LPIAPSSGNTLVIYIEGDNGASAEGTLQGTTSEVATAFAPESLEYLVSMIDQLGSDRTYNHYPVGWAHAMDTPFQWTKQVASHFGGTRNGIAISWPKGIKARGELRSQFHHVIDIVPTILEAAGIQAPLVFNGTPQKPIEGVSMVYTFDDAKAPTRHTTQYFEIVANRAIYHDGWTASTTPGRVPWQILSAAPDPDDFPWELYNVAEDFSQSKNLAKDNPKKLADLQASFLIEAVKYNVLPLDSSFGERSDPTVRPNPIRGQTQFTYYPGMIRIPEANSADVHNKSFRITGGRSRGSTGNPRWTFRWLGFASPRRKADLRSCLHESGWRQVPETRTRPALLALTSWRPASTPSPLTSPTTVAVSARGA